MEPRFIWASSSFSISSAVRALASAIGPRVLKFWNSSKQSDQSSWMTESFSSICSSLVAELVMSSTSSVNSSRSASRRLVSLKVSE